jgi:hypothetical protein
VTHRPGSDCRAVAVVRSSAEQRGRRGVDVGGSPDRGGALGTLGDDGRGDRRRVSPPVVHGGRVSMGSGLFGTANGFGPWRRFCQMKSPTSSAKLVNWNDTRGARGRARRRRDAPGVKEKARERTFRQEKVHFSNQLQCKAPTSTWHSFKFPKFFSISSGPAPEDSPCTQPGVWA